EWVNYDKLIRKIQDPSQESGRRRRLYLNQAAGAADAFLDPSQVEAMVDHTLAPLTKGDTVCLGYDYASGNIGEGRQSGNKFRIPDSTALVALRTSDMSI